MGFDDLKLCRLCMSTSFLEDLYYLKDGDSNLISIIFFCFDIMVQQGDGLPSHICKDCLKKVKMFNNFKQTCLNVDRNLKHMLETPEHDSDIIKLQETSQHKLNIRLDNQVLEVNLSKTFKANNDIIIEAPNKVLEISLQLADKININTNSRSRKINNNSNNSYQCEHCGRIFKMKTVLEKHIATHTGVKPYVCKLCPKRFTRAENRTIHMRSHLGIKPYICEICGSSSTKRQDLIRHMKIHSDERKYSCSVCHRNFKRSSDVISHKRTHTGLRPYKCNTCGKTYTSHGGLRKHHKTPCK